MTTISLTLPDRAIEVATLVLGGIGTRLDLPYERMDGSSSRVLNLLDAGAGSEVSVIVDADGSTVTVAVEPLVDGARPTQGSRTSTGSSTGSSASNARVRSGSRSRRQASGRGRRLANPPGSPRGLLDHPARLVPTRPDEGRLRKRGRDRDAETLLVSETDGRGHPLV